MNLLALGLNHHSAPLTIRERSLLVASEAMPSAFRALLQTSAVNEAVILATCHRTEVYSYNTSPDALTTWLAAQHQLTAAQLSGYVYAHQGERAIRHLLRVACGLDSMIVGEPQVFGQLKQAVSLAQQNGALGQGLQRIFQIIFAASKQIRNETKIGQHPISLAYTILKLAQQIFTDIKYRQVLLIGAGETIELVATHFFTQGVHRLLIANRSLEKAQHIAKKVNGQGILIGNVPAYLAQADIVVSATASQLPILGKGAVESALKIRNGQPMFMADLAVPRDIEPEIASLQDVHLYHLEDLQEIIAANLKNRAQAAQQAEAVIATQATHLMQHLQALDSAALIRRYRQQIQTLTAVQLQKAQQQLQQGKSADLVLQAFAHQLTQKILHAPSVQLRKAAMQGEIDMLLLAKQLFCT